MGRPNRWSTRMSRLVKASIRAVAGSVHDALVDSADELEHRPRAPEHDRKMTLVIVAGVGFVLGLLWARARARNV